MFCWATSAPLLTYPPTFIIAWVGVDDEQRSYTDRSVAMERRDAESS